MNKLCMIGIGLAACLYSSTGAETLTYVDLVGRLTDLEQLATLPAEGERCAQWSSYDRKSQYDEASGQYVQWSANGDGSGIIREEDGKSVLAEMEGPGVIWRIWSALAEKGHVKIYLDGADTPAVDLPFVAYFNHKSEPFTRPHLVYQAAPGFNCYVPIPYQKSCKIVAEDKWGRYYHFTYATYPKGTRLPTFKRDLSPEESAALDRAEAILGRCGTDPAGQRPGEANERQSVTVAPGQTAKVVALRGRRAITAIRVRMDLPKPPDDRDVLRELVLRITWDGQEQPSVWSPLGDFFGTAPGVNEYRSFTLGMTPEGFYSYWYMPFASSALVELTNDGKQARTVDVTITHAPVPDTLKDFGRFHARWHRDIDLDPARPIDWTILKTRGRGRYCGVMLHVWNPRGGWWGEGDEKFFVDGEKFPSTFGTGSEDYFGYAWCSEKLFQQAFHNQTVSVANNACGHPTPEESGGHVSNNRWHIADNVPFHTSFEGAIEKYFPNERPTRYACVAYWYQAQAHQPWPPIEGVEQRVDTEAKLMAAFLDFLRQAKECTGSTPIEPLRQAYERLLKEPSLASDRVRMTLRMAGAEKAAGHDQQVAALAAPYLESLSKPFKTREFVDEVSRILGEPSSKESKVRPLLVANDDGSTERVQKQDRWCIATQRQQGKSFIYFALPENKNLRNRDRTVRLKIDYYADGQPGHKFEVQYDSHYSDNLAGYYHPSDPVVVQPGDAGWRTVVVLCPRARLGGRQNARADFRIAALGEGEVYIGGIEAEPAN